MESKRVDGKPRSTILEYLGTADTLLERLSGESEFTIKSYSHGDTAALLNIAEELDIINIINRHIPALSSGKKPIRDGLTVGASLVLAALLGFKTFWTFSAGNPFTGGIYAPENAEFQH